MAKRRGRTKAPENTKPVSLLLDSDTFNEYRSLCVAKGSSVSGEIRRFIDKEIRKSKRVKKSEPTPTSSKTEESPSLTGEDQTTTTVVDRDSTPDRSETDCPTKFQESTENRLETVETIESIEAD